LESCRKSRKGRDDTDRDNNENGGDEGDNDKILKQQVLRDVGDQRLSRTTMSCVAFSEKELLTLGVTHFQSFRFFEKLGMHL
jgi:hypothetical protein